MIEVKELRKAFGPIVAVDGVSFSVGQGDVLGFLGPNGAGKTTTMKMLRRSPAGTSAATRWACARTSGTWPRTRPRTKR